MKKSVFRFILLILIYVPVFCCSSLVCFGADYSTINECLNNARKLKDAGDIDGAVLSIQRVLSIADALDSSGKESAVTPSGEDIYTKEYLQLLIKCLKADEITYTAIIKHIASVIKETKELFFEMADELKAGKFSKDTASSIKEMKLQMSREMLTHSFCVPPKGYKKVYDVIQKVLFWYSKAWGNLELIAFEKTNEKVKIEAEALFSFQNGNELFSQAGTLMPAIPTR